MWEDGRRRGRQQRREGGGCTRVTSPDQSAPRIISHLRLRVQEFVFQRGELLIIQRELELEGPIGHSPTALEHGERLVEDLLKGHCPPSLCRWGVQKAA